MRSVGLTVLRYTMASAEGRRRKAVKDLPQDVIVDNILPRLPAVPLIRFKCVCKLWYRVISDPSFPKSHLLLQTPGHVSIRQGSVLYFKKFSDEKESYKVNLFDILGEPRLLPIKSCNGLLLLRRLQGSAGSLNHMHYIINPVTRQYMEIPSASPFTNCFMQFDNVSEQYKVLGWNANDAHNHVRIYVLILDDCSVQNEIFWRIFKPANKLSMISEATLFNGWYHWIVRKHGEEELAIFAFNIEHEEFKVVKMPDTLNMVPLGGWVYNLVASNVSLYLSQHHCLGGNYCYNIWSLDGCEQLTWTEMCQYRVECCEQCKEHGWDKWSSASTSRLDVMEILTISPQYCNNVSHTNSLVWIDTKLE